jgi:hypothetical protein
VFVISFWLLLGMAIGVAAAQKRGFSTINGVIGGLLLGPLAFLMFFASGGSDRLKKCPYCSEWVKPDAQVCKHCTRDISPRAMVQARHAAEAAKKARAATVAAPRP